MNSNILIQALESTSSPVTIADVRQPDHPLIFCNQAFIDLTGYSRDEVIGKNCRFLQGDDTDSPSVHRIRTSIVNNKESAETLLNYKKDGTPFWNDLLLSPITSSDGIVTHYVGFQVDITERLEKERSNDLVDRIQREIGFEERMNTNRDYAVSKIRKAVHKIEDLSKNANNQKDLQLGKTVDELNEIADELDSDRYDLKR